LAATLNDNEHLLVNTINKILITSKSK
jgi:hypothetical protein